MSIIPVDKKNSPSFESQQISAEKNTLASKVGQFASSNFGSGMGETRVENSVESLEQTPALAFQSFLDSFIPKYQNLRR